MPKLLPGVWEPRGETADVSWLRNGAKRGFGFLFVSFFFFFSKVKHGGLAGFVLGDF